ncbi:MAG: cell division protein ZipA C-terminal FtsZ-binding domain-containing protein [Burkholderiaceae bacterium]
MSDLQLSLIVLALIAIGGIWLFNIVMDRRRSRVFEKRLKPRATAGPTLTEAQPDAVVDARNSEPTLRSEPSFSDAMSSTDDAGTDALVEQTDPDVRIDATPPTSLVVDREIHAIVTLEPDSPLSGERAWSLLHAFRHAGRQSVMLIGVRGDLQEPIRAGQRYEAVLVAVQLANRSGPLNEIEWSEFVAALQHVSEQIPASCDIPDMRETTARARALDAQCVPLDAQIGINLTSTQDGWTGPHVAQLARDHGLILRPDGRFHALDEHGATLFVLQNGDGGAFRADTLDTQQTSRLTLLLDVPRAPQDAHPFDRLVELANLLSVALDAAIVDDQSHILAPAALASIARQIAPVYAKLEAAGMPAGSPRALALFG